MLAGLGTSLVDYVDATERRRVTVAAAIPALFWLAVELTANLGVLPLGLAAGLAAFLYTRDTARETLALGTSGTGLLLLGLFALQLYQSMTGGSTESLAATTGRLAGWPIAGITLIALGTWLQLTTANETATQ